MVDFTNKTFEETYRDFYKAEDGYHRVLFNSGKALQARELIESQTIIQEEIARFGRNIFKEGALVNPGGATVDNRIEYIRLDVSSVVGQELVGVVMTDGVVEFKVLEVIPATTIAPIEPLTMYVQYTDTSSIVDTTKSARVAPSATLTRVDAVAVTAQVAADGVILAAGRGTKAYFSSGDFFVQGHFVFMEGGSAFIDKYSALPTTDIGFLIQQNIITESEDVDLFDNQGEVPDQTAPGAHRYQIKLIPTTRDQVEVEENFVFVARVVDGVITREVSTFDGYNRINDLLAQRTKEESGNYVVENFKAIFEEKDATNLNLDVTEGIAYVDGYRLEIGTTDITVPKSRELFVQQNEPVPALYGNYVYIDPATTEGFGRINVFGFLRLKNGSDVIGYANVRGIELDAKGYRLYLFNIRMDGIFQTIGGVLTKVGTENFSDVTEMDDTLANTVIPLLDDDSTLYGTSDNNLLFPLPRTSPSKTSILSSSYTIQKYNAVTSDTAGEITLSGVEYASWIIALADGPIQAIATSNGTYTGLTPSTDYVVMTFEEVTAAPKTKTITIDTVTQSIPTVDWQIRPVDLDVADVFEIVSVKHKSLTATSWAAADDITDQFTLDGGQRDNYYDNAKALVKSGYQLPFGSQSEVQVEFKYYVHSTSGRYYAASSYIDDTYESIPDHITATGQKISLRDVLDFRPVRLPPSSYTNEFDIVELPQNASAVTIDAVSYYSSRIDVLVANATDSRGGIGFGELQVIQGKSAHNPRQPEIPTGSLALYKFTLNPYTFSSSDVTSTFIPNRRFTMKDIGKLEQRVEDLYELTTLSLLESNTSSLTVLDEDGNARTKAGFIADNFSTFDFSEVNSPDYRASIDPRGQLKPSFRENSVRLKYSADNASILGSEKHGDLVTLPYTDINLVSQTLATDTMNINPFAVLTQTGHMELSPSSDEWVETKSLPPIMQTTLRRLDDFDQRPALRVGRNTNNFSNTGLFTTIPRDVSFRDTTRSIQDFIGEQVTDIEIIPFMRSRVINFSAKGLRPNTKMFAFFGGKDVNDWVRQETSTSRFSDNPQEIGSQYANATGYPSALGGATLLETDANGELFGSFFLPSTPTINFRTGNQEFKLLDVSVNDNAESTVLTRATYSSTGTIESVQRTVRSTRLVGTEAGRLDPLAQTFFVDQIENPNGLFITKARIFVETKDSNIPLQVQIRSVENGIPTTRIVPGAVKFIDSSNVTTTTNSVSGDGLGPAETMADVQASPTLVEFDEPIYLTSGEEYAIILLAESVEYNVYIAETYKNVIGSREDRITQQPTLGSLFLSQNGFTWTPDQTKDLMFELDRAEFDVSGMLILDNATLPNVTLGNNPIGTTLGSSLVKISHEGHGFSYNDTVTLSDIPSDIVGIPASALNGSHAVITPTWDGYIIDVSPETATASVLGGGDDVTASQQVMYDQFVPQVQTITPNGTSISTEFLKVTGTSYGTSRASSSNNTVYTLSGTPETVFLNDFNANSVPGVVGSSDNASGESIKFYLDMSTNDTKVSPLVDLQRVSVLALENVIDNDDAAQHITVPIVIDESSVGVKVIFAANKPTGSDFEVYVKTAVDEDTLTALDASDNPETLWVEATPDNALPSDDNPETFRDQVYTIDTDQFTVFQVKIVMKANSSSKSPVIRDLRAIALVTSYATP